jgi:hypothetical protein
VSKAEAIRFEGNRAMGSTLTKVAVHTLLFVVVIVVMSAVAIWLGLGPVVR